MSDPAVDPPATQAAAQPDSPLAAVAAALPATETSTAERATAEAAMAGLEVWFDTHVRDNAISRSVETVNTIHAALASIRTALRSIHD